MMNDVKADPLERVVRKQGRNVVQRAPVWR